MKKVKFIPLYLMLVFFMNITSFISSAQDPVIIKDYSLKLNSEIFHEEREVLIQHMYYENTPEDSSTDKVPVIIILDPELLFNYTSGLIKFLEYKMDLPSFILVGIPNKTRSEELGFEPDNKFSKFINVEVDSVLTSLFPNRKGLHAIGHSNSADFILYGMINNISSACIISGLLFKREDYDVFNSKNRIPLYCYSGTEDYRIQFVKNLNTLKQRDSIALSNITTEIYENRDHFDIPLSGIEDYIKKQFKQFVSFTEDELEEIITADNKNSTLDKLIELKRENLQYDFTPSLHDIMFFQEFIDSTQFESFFTHLLSLELKDMTKLFSLHSLGEHYEELNELKKALEYYEKMYELIIHNPQMKPQIDASIQQVKEKMNTKEGKKKQKKQ